MDLREFFGSRLCFLISCIHRACWKLGRPVAMDPCHGPNKFLPLVLAPWPMKKQQPNRSDTNAHVSTEASTSQRGASGEAEQRWKRCNGIPHSSSESEGTVLWSNVFKCLQEAVFQQSSKSRGSWGQCGIHVSTLPRSGFSGSPA